MPLSPLTALVGPNGSGKTSLLRAIDLVLGPVWPTLRSIRIPQDFTKLDANREMSINIAFDPPLLHEDTLNAEHEVATLQLVCQPYKRRGAWGEVGDLHVDFKPLKSDGEVPMVAATRPRTGSQTEFRPLNVSNNLRDQARILFIDHRRSLAQHLPGIRGSILGRLFEQARKEFESDAANKAEFKRQYEAAMDLIRSPRIKEIEETIGNTTKRMLGFMGTSALETVDVAFGFTDPANPFNSLRINFTEADIQLPGDELGLGIQSALVVGIFEALRQLGGGIGTVVIEEPEMYLHPQAQRYFYRILEELTERDDCQVIYSTHSPIFADLSRFESVRLCRKAPGRMTDISYVSVESDLDFLAEQRASEKISIGFDSTRSEMLFARKVLLVEGPGDRIAALMVATLLGKDPDAEGLSIISCGGKNTIPFFARTCNALDIPFLVLHDDDLYELSRDAETGTEAREREEYERAVKENQAISAAVDDDSKIFVIQPSLENSLGIGRHASNKPKRVMEELENLDLNEIPPSLRKAVEELFS